MNEVSLYISVPSNRDWKPKFGNCLADLCVHLKGKTLGEGDENYKLRTFFRRNFINTSCLPMARQAFVDEMIEGNFTHWLSLDDDMSFPMDIVDRLIAHDKDIVSCNARQKVGVDKKLGSVQGMDGQPIDSTGKTGLEELRTMGGAIFLARIEAFKHIPKPHFSVYWSPEYKAYVGEDVHFAALLGMNGVKMWCDHDASQTIGHIGDHEYKW